MLGQWLYNNLQNYKKNIKSMKNNNIKIKWENFIEEYKEYFLDNVTLWNNNLEEVKKYININKKRPSLYSKNNNIKVLGIWLKKNITNYNKNKDIMKNSEIKIKWKEFTEEYKEYFK